MIHFSHEANSWLVYLGGYVWEKIDPSLARYYAEWGVDLII